jgi:uncharacterized protein YvpB
MSPSRKNGHWIKILLILLGCGLLVSIGIYLTANVKVTIAQFLSPSPVVPTIISLADLNGQITTATPFQPLPTDTPTPTATATVTPTATRTRTPKPTSTPIPVVQVPTSSEDSGDNFYIADIIGYNQSHSLSCESRSAVDWAGYFGISISEDSFLANLPSSDDPDAGFVGSPDGGEGQLPPNSYGVHANPVAAQLNEYGVKAKAVHGYSFSDLQDEIASGKPVIVWVYGNVWSGGVPVSYTAANGHTSQVIAFEHTVIVIGYDASYVYILDGGMVYARDIWIFKNSWTSLGNMAIIKK